MLHHLANELYTRPPRSTLYHYTSLRGLMGIVETKTIWASEVKYLNDAEELTHLATWVRGEIALRLNKAVEPAATIMRQFEGWTRERLTNGHMLFVAAFTEKGNLLSQWRGYCPFGKGVSVGFSPEKILAIASGAGFSLGRCVYDSTTHEKIVAQILDGVVEEATRQGPSPRKHPSQSYYHVFEELESTILRIGALVKNKAFEEEAEWRLVSPIIENYVDAPIKYREGASMLIPYMEVQARFGEDGEDLRHVYVGPTPTPNLSMVSVSRYLRRHVRVSEVRNSQSPYRG
ncbi:MAG: DUF2971 domain-containing protein [Phenylobacterium sp.]|nr:DUF2971 domain-containing protein [Phenylobacterium sp.]MDZ4319081.1 DUF2971 domain-containing protein [Phenylobacterium sp.]